MSQRNSANSGASGVVQKQPLNVYTVMLIVSCCAILTACLLLWMELSQWGSFPWWKRPAGGAAAAYVNPSDVTGQVPVARLG
jgi:hypothetical protein